MPPSSDLQRILVEAMERLEDEGESALAELCTLHPEHAAELRRRVELLKAAGMFARHADSEREFPERLGDFRLERRLGAGGMGVVYLARQESLGREVALKLIRPEQLYFPGARARFRREVESVARLQHPGIAPVYVVGEEHGLPYFAMERIEGCSLADVLARVAGREPRSLSGADFAQAVRAASSEALGREAPPATAELFAGSWTEVVLRVARALAGALAHAHANGILHRDLKPSNAMVTPQGRVLLMDFGLASSEGAGSLTRTGSAIGSLPYMAPEQLRGEQALVDERTDVYSLGVTLYELLTLRSPYLQAISEQTRESILDGRPSDIRAANPAVPRDAAIVCLSAMQPERTRRYASAEAFARDLGNVLALRPIEARAASRALIARRWVQRHPARAAALALGVVLVLGGPTSYALVQQRAARDIGKARDAAEQRRVEAEAAGALAEKRRIEAESASSLAEARRADAEASGALAEKRRVEAEASLAQAESERQRADQNLGKALDAVDQMLSRVGHKKLAEIPQMEPVRNELLQDALGFYQTLTEQNGEDPQLAALLGRAHYQLGTLQFTLDRFAEAEQHLVRAVELLGKAPGSPEQRELALKNCVRSMNNLANAHWQAGRSAEAERVFAQGIEMCTQTIALLPEDPDFLAERGRLSQNLAVVLATSGRKAEGAPHYARAIADMEALLARSPDSLVVQQRLIEVLSNAAFYLAPDEAVAQLDRAIEIGRSLVRASSSSADIERLYALTLANRAALYPKSGDEQCLELLQEAEASFDALIERFPSTPSYQAQCALVVNNEAVRLQSLERPSDAIERFRKAEQLRRALHAGSPATPSYTYDLGDTLYRLARVAGMQAELAVPMLAEARALFIEAARGDAQNASYKSRLLSCAESRARALLGRGELARALEEAHSLTEALPDWPAGHYQVATVHARCALLGAAEDKAARIAAALDELENALAKGWTDRAALESEADLEPLHAEARWQSIVEALRAREAAAPK